MKDETLLNFGTGFRAALKPCCQSTGNRPKVTLLLPDDLHRGKFAD